MDRRPANALNNSPQIFLTKCWTGRPGVGDACLLPGPAVYQSWPGGLEGPDGEISDESGKITLCTLQWTTFLRF